MIQIQELLMKKGVGELRAFPHPVKKLIFRFLEYVVSLKRINAFLERQVMTRGIDLLDEILEEIEFSFLVSVREKNRIPAEGRLICVANHPLGGLDGLALLRILKEIRPDVRIVANDVLMSIDALSEFFLPVDTFSRHAIRSSVENIEAALQNDEAVIFFPAGEVSRMTLHGVMDGRWNHGPVYFAKRHNAQILPVFVHGHNSIFFYLVSLLAKPLSTLLLAREMFRKRRTGVTLKIGSPIAPKAFASLNVDTATKLLRKQTYALKTGSKGPFETERNIIHPSSRQSLLRQLSNSFDIGSPAPGKRLFLLTMDDAPQIVREISRLREVTFRHVGEGTGKKMDTDRYDAQYHHLVLWDEKNLDIIGAYRLGIGQHILQAGGEEGFYSRSLFTFSDSLSPLLPDAVELGRSFIQTRYWNTFALEYLWAGIGAVIQANRSLRYLFGPASISNSYPLTCKDALVYFYRKWFSPVLPYALSPTPFEITAERNRELQEYFIGSNYREDLNFLKIRMRKNNVSIPTLFRQYSELTDKGGVTFSDFGVDNEFNGCVDGFVLVDVSQISAAKKERFIGSYEGMLAGYKYNQHETQPACRER